MIFIFISNFSYDLEFTVAHDLVVVSAGTLLHQVIMSVFLAEAESMYTVRYYLEQPNAVYMLTI